VSPIACPNCKQTKYLEVRAAYEGYTLVCDNCYDCDCVGDPPEYVALAPMGMGNTQEETIEDWNELVDMEEETTAHEARQ